MTIILVQIIAIVTHFSENENEAVKAASEGADE